MKKFLYCLGFAVSLCIGANAQFRKVPSEVTNAFSAAYPSVTNVSWKDNITNFSVQFDIAGDHAEAKYSAKGEWMQTIRDMRAEELPAPVKDGFQKSKYNDWQQKEIREIKEKNKETVYRFYVIKSNINKRYLFFNDRGQLTRDALTL